MTKPELCPINGCKNNLYLQVFTQFGIIWICEKCYEKGVIYNPKILKENIVILSLLKKGKLTRPEISNITLIPLTTCFERLNFLISQGKIIVEIKKSGKRGPPKKFYKFVKKVKMFTTSDWNNRIKE